MCHKLCLRNLVCDKKSLLHITVGADHFNRVAFFVFTVDVLLHLPGVFFYEASCGIYDVLGRAVVAFKLECPKSRKAVVEVEDVGDVCAPERIYALRIVAHHAHGLTAVACEAGYDEVLGEVGVLILVHEYVSEKLLVMPADIWKVAQKYIHVIQNVVEVHSRCCLAPLYVGGVYVTHHRAFCPAVGFL